MICPSRNCRKKYLIRAGPTDCTIVGKWSYKTERLIVNPNCFSKNRCGQQFSPSHLSISTLLSVPARITTYQCLRSSAISGVIWFLAISSFTRSCHLSFGLPRFRFPSTVISSAISFLVASYLARLCTCPNHLNLFSLRNSAIGYMCASFQMSTFLTWSSLVFPLAHHILHISVVCNFLSSFFPTAQHPSPYTMGGFIAVLYTLSFNFVGGKFLSRITPVVSLHFDQAIFTLWA